MEVRYELISEDLYAFQWRAAYQSPAAWRARRWGYISLLLAFLLIAWLPSMMSGRLAIAWINVFFFVTVFPVVAGLYWLIERRTIRRAIHALVRKEKPDKGQLGTHTVVLGDDAVTESTAVGEARTSWAGVDRVERNEDYIFIYTSAAAAFVIPTRAFTGSQAEDFYQLARRLKDRAGLTMA